MKVIKPMKLGILHKTYTFKFRHYSVIAPIVFFRVDPEDKLFAEGVNPKAEVLPENLQWPLIQEALGNDILDMVMPKPTGEVLIAGKAFNPNPETSQFQTLFEVGDVHKALKLHGKREWTKRFMGLGYTKSEAEPVAEVELSMENAFGGEGFDDNPVGKGFYQDKKDKQLLLAPIEDLDAEVKSIKNRPAPAGFGQLPITHSQRAKFNGNYNDKKWLEEHFPALAPDTDMRLFQAARTDQQCEGYLEGDEPYVLSNLHPEQSIISGQLPDVRVRAFITRGEVDLAAVATEEVELNLDTLWFFPNQEIGALIYHGQIEVTDPDGLDVSHLMLAYENQSDEPRNTEYYQSVLKERIDPETAMLVAAEESQLCPVKPEEQLASEQQEIEEEEAEQAAIMAEQQEQAIEDIKAANGGKLPADFKMPPPPKPPKVLVSKKAIARGDFNIKALMAEAKEQQKQAEQQKAALEAEMAPQLKQIDALKTNADPAKLAETTKKVPLSEQVSAMKGMADESKDIDIPPEKMAEIQELQEQASQYTIAPLSEWPEDELAQEKRAVFVAALEAGENMSHRDWSGCDLSELDLSGIEMTCCNLENCNLENTAFVGCDLRKTGFAGAKLISTNFTGANLEEANFSSTIGYQNIFTNANLNKCLFVKSCLPQSQMQNCDLTGANFMEADFSKSQFSVSKLNNASFINSQLSDCDFDQINATMLSFMQSDLTLSRWNKAKIERSAFLECPMPVSNLAQVNLVKCQFSGKSGMDGSQLSLAQLSQCGLRRISAQKIIARNTVFDQCDMGDSQFQNSDFIGAQLIQTVLSDSDFEHCKFTSASFYTSLMRKTQLTHCELTNSNFLDADATLTNTQNSNFKDAVNVAPLLKRRWKNVAAA